MEVNTAADFINMTTTPMTIGSATKQYPAEYVHNLELMIKKLKK